MAARSEFAAKQILSEKQLESAMILEDHDLLEQSAAMYWISLRTLIFSYLAYKNIEYQSTNEAIATAISALAHSTDKSDLMFLSIVGTMAEWDENFAINKRQLDELKVKYQKIRSQFNPTFPGVRRAV